MNAYSRGIASHVIVWLFLCVLWPFIIYGFRVSSLVHLGWMPLMFLVGAIPLVIGSAIWMLLFLIPRVRSSPPILYHAWVASGAALALLASVELGPTGDPRPPTSRYVVPAIIAFATAVVASMLLATRSKTA